MPSKNKIVETARYLTKSIKGNNFVNSCCLYANTGWYPFYANTGCAKTNARGIPSMRIQE